MRYGNGPRKGTDEFVICETTRALRRLACLKHPEIDKTLLRQAMGPLVVEFGAQFWFTPSADMVALMPDFGTRCEM